MIAGLGWLLLGALGARADVRLPALFTEGMVLQRDIPVPIWGWANDGEKITVKFRNQQHRTVAHHGKWMIRLEPLTAGGPNHLIIVGKNRIVFANVLVGEVWLASGQSNMEFPLKRSFEVSADIAAAANPNLRLFTVPKLKAELPVDDVKAAWEECNPQTVPDFSAVAYYFGRDLQRALRVPVGLIHSSWGGSPAEVWMSEAALAANPDYQRDIVDAYPAAWHRYMRELQAWQQAKAQAAREGQTFNRYQPFAPWRPSELYNGMIAPLIPYAIRGVIWYQGESNAGRAWEYRTLFPDLIRNWRRDWGEGNFTFLAVQLAPFMRIRPEPGDSAWAELRDAQLHATQVLPNVGLAVITDVGDEMDIHPTKKAPVGARLALAARGIAYHERTYPLQPIIYSGPVCRGQKIEGNKIILSFESVGEGLVPRGGELKGFAIAGADRKFVWAKAEIHDNKVIVSSPQVANPVGVRYDWADYPIGNLWNKNGLPASPFRTDRFPLTTQPKP
ncbi:MAG: sialate O-acetylesterase [Verrucomicrobia bacterium]|nr:sialate O-acetylesterase [Verrucomicrobiota bacterium]